MAGPDAQALFRAARAQRDFKGTKLSKEQLRNLKERRSSAAQATSQSSADASASAGRTVAAAAPSAPPEVKAEPQHGQGSMEPPPARHIKPDPAATGAAGQGQARATDQTAHQAASGAALPSGFFEEYAEEPQDTHTEPTIPRPGQEPQTVAPQLAQDAGRTPPGGKPPEASALPKGFFENEEADAKARGEAPVRKKTAAEEYDDFMTSIAMDVRDMEAREQVEAAEAAEDRRDREDFEQWVRLDRVNELKLERQQARQHAQPAENGMHAVPLKRKRAAELLQPELNESEDDDDELEEDLLDWRAKRL